MSNKPKVIPLVAILEEELATVVQERDDFAKNAQLEFQSRILSYNMLEERLKNRIAAIKENKEE